MSEFADVIRDEVRCLKRGGLGPEEIDRVLREKYGTEPETVRYIENSLKVEFTSA